MRKLVLGICLLLFADEFFADEFFVLSLDA